MNFAINRAGPEDEAVFANLMQLYGYDFSELLRLDIGADGRFALPDHQRYWTDPRYHPFLIRVDQHLAGFAVVDGLSRLTGEPGWDMSQFFILRRHRTAGIGSRAAIAAFDTFRGPWEVREAALNAPAQAFWRKVIDRYTQGRYQEEVLDDERWHGPVQRFDNRW